LSQQLKRFVAGGTWAKWGTRGNTIERFAAGGTRHTGDSPQEALVWWAPTAGWMQIPGVDLSTLRFGLYQRYLVHPMSRREPPT
jgi:hypothetical protein